MHPTALLILTAHVSALCKGDTVRKILTDVKKLVKSTLYVHLNNVHDVNNVSGRGNSKTNITKLLYSTGMQKQHCFNAEVLPFVTKFYSEAALHCGHLDINLLLHNIGEKSTNSHVLPKSVGCILVDLPEFLLKESCDVIRSFVNSRYVCKSTASESISDLDVPVCSVIDRKQSFNDDDKILQESQAVIHKKESVVLGGTFDHIHTGHKVLLSEAILLASRKIVIGVSDGPLLERKTLKELIQPVELRTKFLEEFVISVSKSGLDLNITSIQDPYGPSVTDPDINVIVVSKETEKGGHMVNEKRKSQDMSLLEVHVIGQGTLLEESDSDGTEIPFDEHKASSSNARFRLLGTLLRPINESSLDFLPSSTHQPYIIGLTGGIASGKSSVAKRLQGLGAIIIDCDKLGHQTYRPGTTTFDLIVKHFGNDIVAEDGTINRRKLGERVFSDKSQLDTLNAIVWHEIERLCKKEIARQMQEISSSGSSSKRPVFVLDAAVLLDAEWNKFVHEVWVINVSASEAVKRIMDRNNLSEDNARMRIDSQRSNEWRTGRANVVLSTLWDPSVTQSLVEKSWNLLQQRLEVGRTQQRGPKL